ncbi:MAG: ABC transporter permease [Acidobacteriota bacterium]
MSALWQDLRLSFRQLAKSPGFTTAAVVCLALGIGANATVFSYAYSMLFSARPGIEEPDRLVRVFTTWSHGIQHGSMSVPDHHDIRERADLLTDFASESPRPIQLAEGDRTERLMGSIVTANYFDVLGVEPSRGRLFDPEAHRTIGAAPVVVISHDFWQRRFDSDPDIVGRRVILNGHPFTVIGVAAVNFSGPNVGFAIDIWTPLAMQEITEPGRNLHERRSNHWLNYNIGRLAPGVTRAQAQAQFDAIAAQLTESYPDDNTGKTFMLIPENEGNLHPMVRNGFVGAIGLLFGIVGLILLLACANVAGLLLARATGRRREIAVRLALGASRWRLIRQLLTESLVLSLFAGGVGLLLGVWLMARLASLGESGPIPLDFTVDIDFTILAFTFGIAIATGVFFGLVPALAATRANLVPALKDGVGNTGSGAASRLRRILVTAQIALSLTLLIGAGLALQSLRNAQRLDVGFEPDYLAVASVDLGRQGYTEEQGRDYQRRLLERVRSLPGVESAAWGESLPMSMQSKQTGALPAGYEVPDGADEPSIDFSAAASGYFETLDIPLIRGRGFEIVDLTGGGEEGDEAQRVMVVNQAFVNRYWPDRDPLGATVQVNEGEPHRVIGVVPTGKYFALGEAPKPFMYLPLDYVNVATLHVRTVTDPASMLPQIESEAKALDPNLPLYDVKTAEDHLGFALLPPRSMAIATTVFAVLALLLATIGLYAVIAFWVRQGIRDIGVRIALGAAGSDVVRMVVGRGLRLTAGGLLVGLVGGYLLARVATSVFLGVSAVDVGIYVTAAAVLASAALVASLVPAMRAVRVDPMQVLRAE